MLSRRLGWLGWLAIALPVTMLQAESPAPAAPGASRHASIGGPSDKAAGTSATRAAADAPARTADAIPEVSGDKADARRNAAAKPDARPDARPPVDARIDANGDAIRGGTPEARPESARRKLVAAAVAASPGRIEPKALTGDPGLGKADRVDGYERKGVVAFTFDDGPSPETTPQIIDALEKYDVPAAFFVVTQRIAGKHGDRSRAVLRRELEAGFVVGSHSVSHRNLKRAAGTVLTHEIDGSVKALSLEANRPIDMFRAPYGSLNAAGRGRLKKLGLTETLWSVDTLDWKAHDPAKLRKKVMSMIKADGGGVVLMHDVKPITAQVMAGILDDLEAENCARLDASREPILPVSIHYFLKDGKTPRALPRAVQKRTAAYRAALPERCAKRPR